MSAIVCGKRSSIFEDSLSLTANPPVSKRIRCSSSSPVRFSPPRQNNSSFPSPSSNHSPPHLIEHLKAIFPYMDHKVLEKALGECGDNLDSAIRSLNELHIGSTDNNLDSASAKFDVTPEANVQSRGAEIANGEVGASEELSAPQDPPMDGADWVELFVREMMSSSNVDDARARTSRVLEVLERSIRARSSASAEAAQTIHQENMMLKEQVESLIQENTILKRAVSIQHDRQKENEERSQELLHLKQLVSQYQEQLRTLEWTMLFGMEILSKSGIVNNYALTMHLKQSQQSNSIPGRFHPDVF